jgi:hypothetical protein
MLSVPDKPAWLSGQVFAVGTSDSNFAITNILDCELLPRVNLFGVPMNTSFKIIKSRIKAKDDMQTLRWDLQWQGRHGSF